MRGVDRKKTGISETQVGGPMRGGRGARNPPAPPTTFRPVPPAVLTNLAGCPRSPHADTTEATTRRLLIVAISPCAECHANAPASGDRQHGEAVIVDVLTDQVDAARRGNHPGFLFKPSEPAPPLGEQQRRKPEKFSGTRRTKRTRGRLFGCEVIICTGRSSLFLPRFVPSL